MERIKISGYTLIEIMLIIAIMGIALAVVSPSIAGRIRRQVLESYLSGLEGDMKKSRVSAMSEGTRTVILIVGTESSALDFDGDKRKEHYISFIDNDRNSLFTPGDRLLYRNDWGNVQVVTNTLSPIIFLPQGSIIPGSATRRINIKFPDKPSEYSLELLSILGMTRIKREHL